MTSQTTTTGDPTKVGVATQNSFNLAAFAILAILVVTIAGIAAYRGQQS